MPELVGGDVHFESSGISGPMQILSWPGDTFVREIVGFSEIRDELDVDRSGGVEGWFEDHVHLVSQEDRKLMPKILRQMADAASKAADHLQASREGENVGSFTPIMIQVPGGELGGVVESLTGAIYQAVKADKAKLVSRAFL